MSTLAPNTKESKPTLPDDKMDSLYPETPVYLALALAVAVAGFAANLALSPTALKSGVEFPRAAGWLIVAALSGAALHLLVAVYFMMESSFSNGHLENGRVQFLHLGIVALGTIGAILLYVTTIRVNRDVSFRLRE